MFPFKGGTRAGTAKSKSNSTTYQSPKAPYCPNSPGFKSRVLIPVILYFYGL